MDSLLDTIVAPATPLGRSAVALVRVSGARTQEILRELLSGRAARLRPRHATLVTLKDASGETIDRGLATFFPGPDSYTGEDLAELSTHGNPVLVARLLAAIVRAGARFAGPGEFTERAFHHGKIDLVSAEAVRDLIDSRTEAAARLSFGRLEGGVSRRLRAVREDLVAVATLLAGTIDFAEDVGEELPAGTREALERDRAELARLVESYETARLLSAGSRVAILGAPNAGKSTLFNALLGTARAIVTDVAGTTRDALEGTLDIGGIPVTLVDTAGLRESENLVERIGIERAWEEAERADAILYVADASTGWTAEDARASARFLEKPVFLVANKSDLPAPAGGGAMPPRALAACGLDASAGRALRELLEKALALRIRPGASEVLGSLRQRDLVERARAGVAEALESLARRESPEYVAEHVKAALHALAEVFGEVTSEDVLRGVFASFCIGK